MKDWLDWKGIITGVLLIGIGKIANQFAPEKLAAIVPDSIPTWLAVALMILTVIVTNSIWKWRTRIRYPVRQQFELSATSREILSRFGSLGVTNLSEGELEKVVQLNSYSELDIAQAFHQLNDFDLVQQGNRIESHLLSLTSRGIDYVHRYHSK